MEQLFLIYVLSPQTQDARKAANLTAVGRAVQLSLCFQNFQKATVIGMNITMNQRSSRAVLQSALNCMREWRSLPFPLSERSGSADGGTACSASIMENLYVTQVYSDMER